MRQCARAGPGNFADAPHGAIWKQTIDRRGWPAGKTEVFADFSGTGLAPDGAVCDAEGNAWVAQWGAWRVACHGSDGRFIRSLSCGAARVTCPALSSDGLRQMFVTSAASDLPDGDMAYHLGGGHTSIADRDVSGMAERRVVL